MRQGQAALIVVALWLVMGAVGPSQAEVTWDTGCAIEAELENKEIDLPISLVSPSTGTMACTPNDLDHWIDPEEAIPLDEGEAPDSWANWEEGKCWWGTEGGQVTCDGWTTTWTAPATGGGYFRLGCSVDDLPLPCSRGTREDGRIEVGTEPVGGGGGGGPRHPAGFSATLEFYENDGQAVVGGLVFPNDWGLNIRNTAEPLEAEGFFKKVQWVARITPGDCPGAVFNWVQMLIGETVEDDVVTSRHTDWEDDSPIGGWKTDGMDAAGKVYMIDGPGYLIEALTLPPGTHYKRMNQPFHPNAPVRFYNELWYRGKRISTNHGDHGSGDWERRLMMLKEAGGFWIAPVNQ